MEIEEGIASSSSSRREDFRRGLEEEFRFDLDLRLESIESSSSSSRRRILEDSEPTRDRPELDRPKLNMVPGEVGIWWFFLDYHRSFTLRSGPIVDFGFAEGVVEVWNRCRVTDLVANR